MVQCKHGTPDQSAYIESISCLRALESDSYLSYPAFAHVVLAIQSKRPELTSNFHVLHFMASFFDNLGFLVTEGKTMSKAVKYFDRCMLALNGCIECSESIKPLKKMKNELREHVSKFTELATLAATAIELKKCATSITEYDDSLRAFGKLFNNFDIFAGIFDLLYYSFATACASDIQMMHDYYTTSCKVRPWYTYDSFKDLLTT